MLCRAVAFGGAVCVLGIRPYATRAPLDDLGYRMLLANVNKLAERPGAIWNGSSFGLYEQIGSDYRQQDARVGCVLRNEEGIVPTTRLWQCVA